MPPVTPVMGQITIDLPGQSSDILIDQHMGQVTMPVRPVEATAMLTVSTEMTSQPIPLSANLTAPTDMVKPLVHSYQSATLSTVAPNDKETWLIKLIEKVVSLAVTPLWNSISDLQGRITNMETNTVADTWGADTGFSFDADHFAHLGFITGIPWVPTSVTVTITTHTVPSTVTVKKPYRTYTVS